MPHELASLRPGHGCIATGLGLLATLRLSNRCLTARVREHLDEVQRLRSERGVPLLDPADPKTKERYGL
jgi:hypothetical protein